QRVRDRGPERGLQVDGPVLDRLQHLGRNLHLEPGVPWLHLRGLARPVHRHLPVLPAVPGFFFLTFQYTPAACTYPACRGFRHYQHRRHKGAFARDGPALHSLAPEGWHLTPPQRLTAGGGGVWSPPPPSPL